MSELAHIFHPEFILRNALWASAAVGLLCPLIGAYLMLRRAVLLGVALPHFSAAGISFVLFLESMGMHWIHPEGEPTEFGAALAGSLFATFLGLLILGFLERRGRVTVEGRMGAAYALAFAAAILFVAANPVGETEALAMLHGEIVSVSTGDLRLLLLTFLPLAGLLFVLGSSFAMASFDPQFAQCLGKRVWAWDVLLYTIIGTGVAVGTFVVGPTLTFAACIIPPLATRRLFKRMRSWLAGSSLLGGMGAVIGFVASYRLDWPLGPTIVVVFSALLGACALLQLGRTRLRQSH